MTKRSAGDSGDKGGWVGKRLNCVVNPEVGEETNRVTYTEAFSHSSMFNAHFHIH